VVLSRDGWLKRVRELKDPASTRLREGDALFAALPGTTRDRLALFSSQGTVYVIRVAEVPATTGYGEPVQSLLKFGDGERVVAARLLREEAPTAGGPGARGAAPRVDGGAARGGGARAGGAAGRAGGDGARLRLPRHARSLRDDARGPADGTGRRG